jgi:hypothetical protein
VWEVEQRLQCADRLCDYVFGWIVHSKVQSREGKRLSELVESILWERSRQQSDFSRVLVEIVGNDLQRMRLYL